MTVRMALCSTDVVPIREQYSDRSVSLAPASAGKKVGLFRVLMNRQFGFGENQHNGYSQKSTEKRGTDLTSSDIIG